MIHPKEINALAQKYKLNDPQVEKDYVLSWILFGISQNEILFKALVFKGGTVLKKVYFPDYRFSEDLDFTLVDETISNDTLLKEFESVYAFVKEKANITLQFKESQTHISGSIGFYINYVGPLKANINSRDVKIDITRGERMEYPIEVRKVFIEYTDLPAESFSLQCYSLSEVLIEKMTALMGRTEPRDLYDFWYLTEVERMDTEHHKPEFERKARHKGHEPEHFESKVLAKEKNLKQGWQKKMENQINQLPKFDDIFRKIKKYLKI